jgi:3-methyladenine DNA glycosylase AlkD
MIEAIRAGLAARANPDKAPAMQAYMKSEMPFLGVQKPERTALLREVITALDYDAWQTTVLTLWREAAYREERYMALAVAGHRRYREHRTMAALPLFDELIVTGAWWDFVDEVAAGMLGELLDRDGAALAPALRAWAYDDVMWRRRAAIVSQVRRKERTDLALLYDCIEPNRGELEFFLRKGIGWALRAYAWIDPDEIVRYCETHELSPLSRREALRNIARIRGAS